MFYQAFENPIATAVGFLHFSSPGVRSALSLGQFSAERLVKAPQFPHSTDAYKHSFEIGIPQRISSPAVIEIKIRFQTESRDEIHNGWSRISFRQRKPRELINRTQDEWLNRGHEPCWLVALIGETVITTLLSNTASIGRLDPSSV